MKKISLGFDGRNNALISLKITCTNTLVKIQARLTRSNSFNVSTTIPGRANRACNTKWGIWNANFLPSIRHILWLNERQKSDHFYYEENNSYLKAMKGKRGGNHLNLSFSFLLQLIGLWKNKWYFRKTIVHSFCQPNLWNVLL